MPNNVGKVLQIDWEDAWSNGDMWTKAEVEKTKPLIMILYGYCLRDDKSGITVAMERRHTGDDKYRIVWHVPRAMIRKVRVLR
jgi:hypothetical protein